MKSRFSNLIKNNQPPKPKICPMDRRQTHVTLKLLEEILKIPGKITHLEMDYEVDKVKIYFLGHGQNQTAECNIPVTKEIQCWIDYDKEKDKKHE